jgi:undecaprenyl-diphosphatase
VNRAAGRFAAREEAWCLRANRWGAHRVVRAYFRVVSRLGDGAFWYALMAVVAVSDGDRGLQAAAHMALVGGTATLLYRRLKGWARRPRPFAVDGRIRPWVAPLDEFSFPSGHTLHAVGFTIAACLWYPWLGWLLVPFAVSVAASRVVLGMHYPSDVLAAAGIGALLAEGVALLF